MLLSAASSLRAHDVSVVLASSSPRRRGLMDQLLPGVDVRCVPSTFAEDIPHAGHTAASYALATAQAKAAEVWDRVKQETRIMIAADTVVVGKDGKILEKPQCKYGDLRGSSI
jgi:septum formation protein